MTKLHDQTIKTQVPTCKVYLWKVFLLYIRLTRCSEAFFV